jgi:starch phosphorylase
MDDASLRRAFLDHLSFSLGKRAANSTALDRFFAMALTVRDRLTYRWAADAAESGHRVFALLEGRRRR